MKNKNFNKIKKILNYICTFIISVLLFLSIILLIQTFINKKEVPNILGYKFFVITSGSMEPNIKVKNFIISKEIETKDLQIGDVITYRQENIFVTHRIIDIYKRNGIYSFVTKGDNNNVKDSKKVKEDDIEGKYVLKVPFIGFILLLIQTKVGLISIIILPILLTILSKLTKELKK